MKEAVKIYLEAEIYDLNKDLQKETDFAKRKQIEDIKNAHVAVLFRLVSPENNGSN